MPFASGNKKTNLALDQRIAAADQSLVAAGGGVIFVTGKEAPTPAKIIANAQSVDLKTIAITVAIVAAVYFLFGRNK